MQLIDRAYVESNKDEIIQAIRAGKIFIYPTDTIYGLGSNALLSDSVNKIRDIKNRETKPFSVIVPSKEWVEENYIVDRKTLDQYLPGPYTLIVRKRTSSSDTLGVRIPKHWFSEIVQESGVPFVTTSVNISGEKHMESLEDVSQDILKTVDYVVYEGEKKGEPSKKINLV